MPQQRHVAILIFEEAEVLDVAGPFEVFSVAGRRSGFEPFRVSLVAESLQPVSLRNGFVLHPHATVADLPAVDLLVIPGGYGTRREIENPRLIAWIRERAAQTELVLSVCTGSLLLAKAGLLDGLAATTHFGAIDLLRTLAPKARVQDRDRFVDNGKVITSAGVSAGIDMALYVVERLLGEELADEAAAYMEWHRDRSEIGLADEGV